MSTAAIRNLSIAISLTFLSFFGIKAEAADWLMFGGKQLELDYFEMNGKQHRVPGETVYIDNFDNGKCTYQWSGTQDEGNKGTASASGTTLTMTDS